MQSDELAIYPRFALMYCCILAGGVRWLVSGVLYKYDVREGEGVGESKLNKFAERLVHKILIALITSNQ